MGLYNSDPADRATGIPVFCHVTVLSAALDKDTGEICYPVFCHIHNICGLGDRHVPERVGAGALVLYRYTSGQSIYFDQNHTRRGVIRLKPRQASPCVHERSLGFIA